MRNINFEAIKIVKRKVFNFLKNIDSGNDNNMMHLCVFFLILSSEAIHIF